MRLFAPLIIALLFSAPAWAEGVVNHRVMMQIDPFQGTVLVEDHITLTGQGKTTFSLSSAFKIKKLRVDGKAQRAVHDADNVRIDLGSGGDHEIRITTKAKIKGSNQLPFLNAEGGFLSSDWLAHPQGQLASWTIHGKAPKGQKWLMPGQLTFEADDDHGYRASFTSQRPSPLPVLITGPFQISERMSGDIRIRTYFHSELTPLADGYLKDTARYIEEGVNTIGPYPYTEFSIVSGTAPVGWGLPGMTYVGRRVLALPFIRTTSLPHEVLHNWWGNAVDVDYESGNWAEGLTTFQADLVQSALKNKDGGRKKRLEWLRNRAALSSEQDMALIDFTSRTHDASQIVGYDKTAFVFQMLKTRLGADTFNAAIQDFYRTNAFQTAGWSHIQAAFEKVSGEDLAAFFKAWVTKPGAPELRLINAKVNGANVTFSLTQREVYPLDIPVRVQTNRGEQNFQVQLGKQTQSFTFTADNIVTALHIDPDFKVFRKLDQSETPPILRDLTLSPLTQLQLVGNDFDVKAIALNLTGQLLQRPFTQADPLDVKVPRIIIGLEPHVLKLAKKSPLEASDAQAWVERDDAGRTTLFIMANSATNLAKFARSLPHYKRRSFVTFNAGKVVRKGVWASPSSPLSKTFSPNTS